LYLPLLHGDIQNLYALAPGRHYTNRYITFVAKLIFKPVSGAIRMVTAFVICRGKRTRLDFAVNSSRWSRDVPEIRPHLDPWTLVVTQRTTTGSSTRLRAVKDISVRLIWKMSLKNTWHHRKVADSASKSCWICFKPSTSVLITPDNKVRLYQSLPSRKLKFSFGLNQPLAHDRTSSIFAQAISKTERFVRQMQMRPPPALLGFEKQS
jgi:hypothetical protein